MYIKQKLQKLHTEVWILDTTSHCWFYSDTFYCSCQNWCQKKYHCESYNWPVRNIYIYWFLCILCVAFYPILLLTFALIEQQDRQDLFLWDSYSNFYSSDFTVDWPGWCETHVRRGIEPHKTLIHLKHVSQGSFYHRGTRFFPPLLYKFDPEHNFLFENTKQAVNCPKGPHGDPQISPHYCEGCIALYY